jgi:hypothetical protein
MLCVLTLAQLWLNCLVASTDQRFLILWRERRTIVNEILIYRKNLQSLAVSEGFRSVFRLYQARVVCTLQGP